MPTARMLLWQLRMASSLRTVSYLGAPLLLFACLKGGTTGAAATDDTGSVDGNGPKKERKSDGDSGSIDDGTDDTGTTGTTSGTDDTATQASTDGGKAEIAGNPGDPCTLGSDCLSGLCPKTTKTCDGCRLVGGACGDAIGCCPSISPTGTKNYCGTDGICAVGKVLSPGDACVKDRDVCPKGSACTGTGSYGKGPTHCTTSCTSHSACASSPHGPVCQENGICGHFDCTSARECKTSVSGHICQTLNSTTTKCGCNTDADCPSSAICHKFQGPAFAYCW